MPPTTGPLRRRLPGGALPEREPDDRDRVRFGGLERLALVLSGAAGAGHGCGRLRRLDGRGIKAVRVYLLARHAGQEMFRMVHPRAVTPLVLGDRVLPERLRVGVLGYFFYAATLAAGTLLIALHQVP